MTRFFGGLCVLAALSLAGCGGGKAEKGPTTEKMKPADPDEIKKGMEKSFETMKNMSKDRTGADKPPEKMPEQAQ